MTYGKMVLADSPAAFWRLNEQSGTGVADSSGNGNAGVYQNGVSLGAPGLIGGGDAAASFDGVDDQVFVPDTPGLSPTAAVSLEAWVNGSSFASGPGGYRTVMNKGNSYWLRVDNIGGVQRARFFIHGGGSYHAVTASGVALVPGSTYHLVGTYDGSTLHMYVNGVDEGAAAYVGGVEDSPVPLVISVSSGSVWDGRLDEVAVYGQALSADQVQAHYTAGLSE